MTYEFRREDNGELIEVGFEQMMEMDAMGCITLEDGVVARRVRVKEKQAKQGTPKLAHDKEIVSDTLGCADHQLHEFEGDARKFNVEFKEDPTCDGFYQAHCKSRQDWARYIKHRGYFDRTSGHGSGAMLGPEHIEKAASAMVRIYGSAEKT